MLKSEGIFTKVMFLETHGFNWYQISQSEIQDIWISFRRGFKSPYM